MGGNVIEKGRRYGGVCGREIGKSKENARN
jgi:hypothetical protein